MSLHLTEAPLTIAYQDGGGLTEYAQRNARAQQTVSQRFEILGNTYEPMGVVAAQVGVHEAGGDKASLVGRHTRCLEDVAGKAKETVCGKGWHREVSDG
jgi:hypothetical protein